jgi:outer membrane immunogenic protein
MRKFAFFFTTLVFSGGSAFGADMAVKAPLPPIVAPASGWTGCYIGGNVGGAWADVDHTWTLEGSIPVSSPLVSQRPSGAAYGGQIGCDYQFQNNWVAGVRGMWDGTNLKATNLVPLPNIGNATPEYYRTNINSFETLTGRLGFLVSPAVMFYGVGGVAWMQDRFTVNTPVLNLGDIASGSESRIGYDVGTGLSWLFARNWDLWVEYDHMGFGNNNITTSSPSPPTTLGFAEKQNIDIVLVGIDYRIGAR